VEQVRALLGAAGDMVLAAEFHSGEEAAEGLPLSKPEVVLMDLDLPGISGAECARKVKYALPGTQILMLTVNEEASALFDSLMAGATGYLSKRTDAQRLPERIREILAGGSPMSAGIARKAIQLITRSSADETEADALSERERQVLERLSRGLLYKEIADELGIQIDTVRNHVRRIYEKLQARNRTEAVLKYQARLRAAGPGK
jgi:DNA-binding NarL/FixJ family response regulator